MYTPSLLSFATPAAGLRPIAGTIYKTRVYGAYMYVQYCCSLRNNVRDRLLDNTVPTRGMSGLVMKWLIDVQ